MSVFAENAWEADATGDKLSEELFRKKRKKREKTKNKLKVSNSQTKDTNLKGKGKAKHDSARISLSEDVASTNPFRKITGKRKFSQANAEDDKSSKKSKSSVSEESISSKNKQEVAPKLKKVKNRKDKMPNNTKIESNSVLTDGSPVKDGNRFFGAKSSKFKSKVEYNDEIGTKLKDPSHSKNAKDNAKLNTAEHARVLTKTQKRKLKRKQKLANSKTNLENGEPPTQQYATGKKESKEIKKKQKSSIFEMRSANGEINSQPSATEKKKKKNASRKNRREQQLSNPEIPSGNGELHSQQSVAEKKNEKKKKRRKEQSSSSEMRSENGEPHSQLGVDGEKKKTNQSKMLVNKNQNTKQDNKIANKVQKLEKLKDKKMRKKGERILSAESLDSKKSKGAVKTRVKHEVNVEKLKRMLEDRQSATGNQSKKSKKPESLRDKMLARLKSSRFRYLNEQLYNSESLESKNYFKEEPDAFVAYHEGYRQQVEQWPLNPIETIIASIQRMPKEYVIADFGCGEAKLAESVPQKVHSLDLVAMNDNVTACDMAHTPLLTSGINVVVFCLSLMGTNLNDYLIEANRVLKKDGILKIAEVESRFDNVQDFINILASYGFVNTWSDLSYNLFYFMDFRKESDVKKRNKLPAISLKPCLYKKR